MDLTNPNELFKELDLKTDGQIKELWPVQIEVLNTYYTTLRNHARVAIELPTGSGKSIISLLVLEMWRKAGKRVAILTSSIALSVDMKRRCEDLGIPSVVITGKRKTESNIRERKRNIREYKRKYAIGIMNYWAYMMGKDIAMPDVLIIDDADSFENLLIDQYSVVITRKNDRDIYNQILNELSKYRVYQRLETFSFLPSSEDIQLVYFPHAFEIASKIRKILSAKGRSEMSEDLFWSFDRNKDKIHTYLMFVSMWEVIFTPYIIAGSMHEKIRNIPHAIYTSATLGTAERIHKTMGSFDEIMILSERDIKSQVGTMGRRIIFPLSDISTGKVDESVLNSIEQIIGTFRKVLVLCNSHSDANRVIDHLQSKGYKTILYKKERDSTLFVNEREGALVTAGRFIGLDLPGEACQVGIVTRMPYVLGPVDILTRDILEDQKYTDEKVSHRLVQGFGRCNRNPGDAAIYFMLDSELAIDMMGNERIYRHFPKQMKAELDYGEEFTDVGGLAKAIEVGQLLLNNKLPDVDKEILDRIRTADNQYATDFQKPFITEVQGWFNLTERQSYLDAAASFAECISLYEKLGVSDPLKDVRTRQIAWLHYITAKCYYLAFLFFRNKRYKEQAIEHLNLSMKFGFTSWFAGLQVVVNELKEIKEEEETIFNLEVQNFKESLLRKWNGFYRRNSIGKRKPLKTWEKTRDILLKGTHNAVCDALEQTLELMGFEVTNLKRAIGTPDMIAFSNVGKRYVVIVEVKTKESSDVIQAGDVDQISGHQQNYQSKYPDRMVYPVVFTNKGSVSETAALKAKKNVRILRSSVFSALMTKYIELMEKGWQIEDPTMRLAFMEKIPILNKFEDVFKPTEQPIVTLDEINAIL